ncbi:MAG: hypothetical protein HYX47_00055 [Burkholderiales bacterium]|nr:hypothetical protein [Burkholderiales bacterium]
MAHFGITFFLSNGLYGQRPWHHFDLHWAAPGWLFVEVGSYTLEIEHPQLPALHQAGTTKIKE